MLSDCARAEPNAGGDLRAGRRSILAEEVQEPAPRSIHEKIRHRWHFRLRPGSVGRCRPVCNDHNVRLSKFVG